MEFLTSPTHCTFKWNLGCHSTFCFFLCIHLSFSEKTVVFFFILKFPPNRATVATGDLLFEQHEWNFLLKMEEKPLPTSAVPAFAFGCSAGRNYPTYPSPLFNSTSLPSFFLWIVMKDIAIQVGVVKSCRFGHWGRTCSSGWLLQSSHCMYGIWMALWWAPHSGRKRHTKAKGTWSDVFKNTEQKA